MCLQDFPSIEEIETEGLALGEMNRLLLQKIEELTLHTIAQQKLIEEQGRLIQELYEQKDSKNSKKNNR